MLSPFRMVCRDFILPEPASYVFFYAIFNLRNLLYIIFRYAVRRERMDAENRRGLRRGRRIRPPFKKKNRHAIRRNDFLGGGRWIRTTEVTDNRFTVCPLWPLGNSPIFTCALKRKLGAGRRTRTPDLLITKCIQTLRLAVSEPLSCFPWDW